MSASPPADDPSALDSVLAVSRETRERLGLFVDRLREWQRAENLVAPSTLSGIWPRHVADSAELVRLYPAPQRWLDIGTGAGFPGMVVAIAGPPGTHVDLVESNTRKCAFLRLVARQTGAPVSVHQGRAEMLLKSWSGPVDRITARAVAPLAVLLELAEPLVVKAVPAAFHKGRDFRSEVAEASQSFDFDLVENASRVGEGVILEITNLRRKPNKG